MDYKKSYDLYLEKVKSMQVKTEKLPSGKIKTTGVRMNRPFSYSEYQQIYPVIKEYTKGTNVLREIVNQTRATSTAQASAAYKIQAQLSNQSYSDGESESGKRAKRYTRAEIGRLSPDEIKNIFGEEYRRFKQSHENGAEGNESRSEVDRAWHQWKVVRGISD